VALPISIPLIWGMFVRRAPQWAGWTTVLAGLGTSFVTYKFLNAQWIGRQMGFALNAREASDWAQLADILMNVLVGSVWFLSTTLMSRTRSTNEIARVDRFFQEMRTPVDFEREEKSAGSDNAQAHVMGLLCLIYGGFITLLAIIPNPLIGRASFVFCGGVMFVVGFALHRAGTRGRRATALPGGSIDPAKLELQTAK
jgi:hypothetical protein